MSDIAVIKNSVMDLQSQVKALSASLSAISNPRLYDEMFPPMPISSSSSFVARGGSTEACPSSVGVNTDHAVMTNSHSNSSNNSQASHSLAVTVSNPEVNTDVNHYSDAVRRAPMIDDNTQYTTVAGKKKNNRKFVIGSCTSSNQLQGVPRKRVFCINRLQPGTTVESVTEYLQSQNLIVDSCYVVQSGGREQADGENVNSERRAKHVTMRLCVSNVDVMKILALISGPSELRCVHGSSSPDSNRATLSLTHKYFHLCSALYYY